MGIKTRVAKRKLEDKNVYIDYPDLVCRNFNPKEDDIIATDVSYIPAKVKQNNIYLSVAISHKTKLIESWKLSSRNNNALVIDTINSMKRNNFILHSDHGSQYSSSFVREMTSSKIYRTSMGRVVNSLDNREVEYFFGCLKGEYLKNIKTWKMSQNEIEKHINWYNTKRLQWKVPTSVSTYAI